MNESWQSWVVLALVVLAAAYSVWYWLPTSIRKPLGALHQTLGSRPSCGSCSSCGQCAIPATSPKAGKAHLPPTTHPVTFHRRR